MSAVFAVRVMDAEPYVAKKQVAVEDDLRASELLDNLFKFDRELLISMC